MSYEEARIHSTRRENVSLKKIDPFLSIGASMALGTAGWFFYQAFWIGGPNFLIFLAVGMVLVGIASLFFGLGGWRPLFL